MNAPARTFEFQPAERKRVSLIIAIAGASGAGKTLSSLKIARGLAGGDDTKIAVVDTEAGRAKHYAVAPGEKPGPDRFAFRHADLVPPFTPEAYMAAIAAADQAAFEVIMIDSCSHEWEGDGGLHDIHDELVREEVERARTRHNANWGPFDEDRAAEKANLGAWRDPKARHKKFVNRLLQCRAHLVLCLRADEKIRIEKVKDDRGRERTVIVQPKDMPPAERWVPICEKRFMYEMTMSFVVTPLAPGVPNPIKLQAQHRAAVPLDRPLSEATGRALAEWAAGGTTSVEEMQGSASPSGGEVVGRGSGGNGSGIPGPEPQDQAPSPSDPHPALAERAREAARGGKAVMDQFWHNITKSQLDSLRPLFPELQQLVRDAERPAATPSTFTELLLEAEKNPPRNVEEFRTFIVRLADEAKALGGTGGARLLSNFWGGALARKLRNEAGLVKEDTDAIAAEIRPVMEMGK